MSFVINQQHPPSTTEDTNPADTTADTPSKERAGEFTIRNSERSNILHTPGCMVYSRSGVVPHLTRSNLDKICPNPILLTPISSLIEQPQIKIMKAYGKGYHEFSCLKDLVICGTIHDTLSHKTNVYTYNEEKSVSVWAPSGRQRITPDSFAEFLDVYGLDASVILSDQIQISVETNKRCRKSNERSVKFTKQLLESDELHDKLNNKTNKTLIVPIEGGHDVFQRIKCIESMLKIDQTHVSGYSLSGLDYVNNWLEIATICCQKLPNDKPRIMPGIFTPSEVVAAIQAGVDIIDTTSAHYSAERGCALNFPLKGKRINSHNAENNTENNKTKKANGADSADADADICNEPTTNTVQQDPTKSTKDEQSTYEAVTKKLKIEEPNGVVHSKDSKSAEGKATSIQVEEKPVEKPKNFKDFSDYEIDLKEKRFFDDFSPLVEGCACFACTQHTRAYINHLLVTNEMLAQVLLTMHNLHHWLEFLKEIRESVQRGTFQRLCVDFTIEKNRKL